MHAALNAMVMQCAMMVYYAFVAGYQLCMRTQPSTAFLQKNGGLT